MLLTQFDSNVVLTNSTKNDTVNFRYREAISLLIFLCTVTRPDISFAVNTLSRYVNNPSKKHVNVVKRVIRYLIKSKDLSIIYNKDKKFVGYSDSDFTGHLDTRMVDP